MQIYSLPLSYLFLLILSCHSFNFSASMVPAASPLLWTPPLAPNPHFLSQLPYRAILQSCEQAQKISELQNWYQDFLKKWLLLGKSLVSTCPPEEHRFSLYLKPLFSSQALTLGSNNEHNIVIVKQGLWITLPVPLVKGKWTGTGMQSSEWMSVLRILIHPFKLLWDQLKTKWILGFIW